MVMSITKGPENDAQIPALQKDGSLNEFRGWTDGLARDGGFLDGEQVESSEGRFICRSSGS